ncbi:MAG: hypothetical protein IH599_00330 [Bacteroidales bacterium]|nr:hypothetical protein [Bacteroidales bacterium]
MLVYHSGTATTYRIIWLNGEQWLTLHHLLTICALPLVTLHIILHWRIVLKLISPAKKHRHKPLNLILLVIFISTAISGLTAWLILKEQNLAGLFHDVHNKLGMALIVFYALHFSLYSPVLLRMSGLNARKKGSQNP